MAQTLVPDGWSPKVAAGQAWVAWADLAKGALVLEDLVYEATEIRHDQELAKFAAALADLLPADETAARERLRTGLILIPDEDFADLMARVVPVRARIKLADGKTTDQWTSPDGVIQKGNLWYEEHLPPDCLFLAFVGQRRQRSRSGEAKTAAPQSQGSALAELRNHAKHLALVQIGGNETVGYGLCWWSGWKQEAKS